MSVILLLLDPRGLERVILGQDGTYEIYWCSKFKINVQYCFKLPVYKVPVYKVSLHILCHPPSKQIQHFL